MSTKKPPEALLLISSHCPHCSQLTTSLVDMLKDGELYSLQLVNLDVQAEIAEQLNVRSVPWLRIGDITLIGQQSPEQLRKVARSIGSTESMLLHLNELLTGGDVNAAKEVVFADSAYLKAVLQVLENPESKINVRVGVGVILEELAERSGLKELAQDLIALTKHPSPVVRCDAAHYLSLTGSDSSEAALRELLNDENKDVREIAQDGLDEMLNQ